MQLYNLTEEIAINFSMEGNSIVITPQNGNNHDPIKSFPPQ